MSAPPGHRVVLIGASNATRGFAVFVSRCRQTWPGPLEILAAIGHGRSYGMESNVLGRRLPSVLACGLWKRLNERRGVPTTAVVTDVGNDVLYGVKATAILEWVDECLSRLAGADLVLTSLPAPVLKISRAHFVAFRTVFFPARHLKYEAMQEAVATLDQGLESAAARHGARFVRMRPEWYRFDPIHIRPLKCRRAWREILGDAGALGWPVGLFRALGVYGLLPERQWLLGREVQREQPVPAEGRRVTLALY